MISRRKFFSKTAIAAGVAALGTATRSMLGAEPDGQVSENPENITGNARANQQD